MKSNLITVHYAAEEQLKENVIFKSTNTLNFWSVISQNDFLINTLISLFSGNQRCTTQIL